MELSPPTESTELRERYHPRVESDFMVKVLRHGRSLLHRTSDLSMAGVFVEGVPALGLEGPDPPVQLAVILRDGGAQPLGLTVDQVREEPPCPRDRRRGSRQGLPKRRDLVDHARSVVGGVGERIERVGEPRERLRA